MAMMIDDTRADERENEREFEVEVTRFFDRAAIVSSSVRTEGGKTLTVYTPATYYPRGEKVERVTLPTGKRVTARTYYVCGGEFEAIGVQIDGVWYADRAIIDLQSAH